MGSRQMIYVDKSPIDGRGVFAAVRIPRGTFLGTFKGPPAKRDGKYVLWVYAGRRVVGRRGRNQLRYLNHCDRPNAEFDGFDLYAKRSIAPGDEITIHYGVDEGEL